MTALSERAEVIAAHVVNHETGSIIEPNGSQRVIDFSWASPDGRIVGLEVTLVTEAESCAWHGMEIRDGWRWRAGDHEQTCPDSAQVENNPDRLFLLVRFSHSQLSAVLIGLTTTEQAGHPWPLWRNGSRSTTKK